MDEGPTRVVIRPEQPSPNTSWSDFAWQERIGFLLPDHQDKWWRLSRASDVEDVVSEVLDTIQINVFPEMQRRLARDD